MMGAATLAPLSTLVSCSDYDDDINNLQAQIDASGVNLKEEVSKLQKLLDECKVAAEKAAATWRAIAPSWRRTVSAT